MQLSELIQHPELLDKETLYDLRSLVALYPYYQTARLLMLKNLYILHDPSFDEELRRAAIYVTDRKVIFNLVEATHYKLTPKPEPSRQPASKKEGESRTVALIDNFLESMPPADDETSGKNKRKPTATDATVDYVSYLMEVEGNEEDGHGNEAPQMKGQDLIDNFINNDSGKITLKEEPEYTPEIAQQDEKSAAEDEKGYYTETLARIFIKQGNYDKALEIIHQLYLKDSKKSVYFADQIRFLAKLRLNNKFK